MPLILENFVAGDPQNTLKEHHARDAYQKLSQLLTRAHTALVRIGHDPAEQAKFTQWFGTYNQANRTQVYNKLRAIHRAVVTSNITFRNGGSACQLGTYAYVRPHTGLTKVYLCDEFFRSGRQGIDSTVGTIIHELSHIVANTHDHAYGQALCQGLATGQPINARANADNYQYYCESFA